MLGFTSDIKGEMMYYLGYILKARNNYDEAAKVMSNAILTGAFSTNKVIEIVSSIGRCFEDRKRVIIEVIILILTETINPSVQRSVEIL